MDKPTDDLSLRTKPGTLVAHTRPLRLSDVDAQVAIIPIAQGGHIASLFRSQLPDACFAMQSMMLQAAERAGRGVHQLPLGSIAVAKQGDAVVYFCVIGTHSYAMADLRRYFEALRQIRGAMAYTGLRTAKVPRLGVEINIKKQIAATANAMQSALIDRVDVCDDPSIGKWTFI